MNNMYIYTDGSSNGQRGFGGAAVLITPDHITGTLVTQHINRLCGNNYCELSAVYVALRELQENTKVTLFTDSQNVIGWLDQGWKRNKPDIDKIVRATQNLRVQKNISVKFMWVKAHAQNKYNNLVDLKARESRRTGTSIKENIIL